MYIPPTFAVEDRTDLFAMIHATGLATFITATTDGPLVTPLPMVLDETEGENGVLYAHLARANPHWKTPILGDGLVLFSGPDAYISPSWYAAKAEHHKVVPTWNYAAVEVRGPVEFFDAPDRLLDVVRRLTTRHEAGRAVPWAVGDAPEAFVAAQLRGIVGLRVPIASLQGKRKMSQNRSEADRQGVRAGLVDSTRELDRIVGGMVPE